MKARIILASFIIPLAMIIAAVPQNTTKPYKLTAEELLEKAAGYEQYVNPDAVADMIIKEDPSLQLIDVRNPDEFTKFSLPGAINIPLTDLLSDEYRPLLNQDIRMNVFYSNGTVKANEAWMVTRQLGYQNNYVLMGGLNYWAETIMSPESPDATSPDEEIARYNFRKGASQALGGAVESTDVPEIEAPPKPIIKKKPEKKRIQGGC